MAEDLEGVRPESPSGMGPSDLDAGLTVETAAIRIGEAVFTLPRPNRHHNVMWWLHVLGVTSGQMHDQGFVLSDGRYADRATAAVVAQEAGQTWDLISPPFLYSEDMWDGGADLPQVPALKAMTRCGEAASPAGETARGPGMPQATANPNLFSQVAAEIAKGEG